MKFRVGILKNISSPKSNYTYPEIKDHKVVYKGKRFWIFEISAEFPYEGKQDFFDVIVYDKSYGIDIAGVRKTSDGYVGELIGPMDHVDVSGKLPIDLLESVINAMRMYERHFSGSISAATARFRKRVAKNYLS